MKKRFFAVFLALILCFSLAGCSKKVEEKETKEVKSLDKIQKSLLELESYKTTATLSRISDKGTNVYETKQYYKKTGEYRIEILSPESVEGSVTIYDGKRVSQYNPRVEGKILMDVPESKARDEMFLGNFIKNYLQSEEVALEVSSQGEGVYTILEAIIPGNHPYLVSEKLWINNESLMPEKLVIFDANGKEVIELIFNDFEYNVKIEESLFKVESAE